MVNTNLFIFFNRFSYICLLITIFFINADTNDTGHFPNYISKFAAENVLKFNMPQSMPIYR